jgi:flagellar basal body-associated protein FliL
LVKAGDARSRKEDKVKRELSMKKAIIILVAVAIALAALVMTLYFLNPFTTKEQKQPSEPAKIEKELQEING